MWVQITAGREVAELLLRGLVDGIDDFSAYPHGFAGVDFQYEFGRSGLTKIIVFRIWAWP